MPMAMIQLVYASRPFGFNEAMLGGILIQARHCNTRDDITGALICRADMYLQMLEGEEDSVQAAYTRIEQDDRHVEVKRLARGPIEARMFGAWAMRHDPAQSWMWTVEEVENGALCRTTPDEVLSVFARVKDEAPVSS